MLQESGAAILGIFLLLRHIAQLLLQTWFYGKEKDIKKMEDTFNYPRFFDYTVCRPLDDWQFMTCNLLPALLRFNIAKAQQAG